MLDELVFSDPAESIKALFYDKEKTVYVEGADDVLFWQSLFSAYEIDNVHVEEVGGIEELKKYIERIERGLEHIYVARDLDYELFSGFENQPKVLVTFGHSIENTIISGKAVQKVVRTHGRVRYNSEDADGFHSWLLSFCNRIKSLLALDIFNEIEGLGLRIMGDNCSRFMLSNHSADLCDVKVSDFFQACVNQCERFDFDGRLIDSVADSTNRMLMDIVRGHFLWSAVLRFINNHIRSLGSSRTLSRDSFFATMILAFESTFSNEHPHYDFYRNEVIKLK